MGTCSEHFNYREFEVSRPSDPYANVIRTPQARDNVKEMVENLLEPLRVAWGGPVTITSGYRNPQYNANIKGASLTSAHCVGWAADTIVPKKRMNEYVEFVKSWLKDNDVPFDQLIDETRPSGSHWLHIGYKRQNGQQRRMVGTCADGKTYKWEKL